MMAASHEPTDIVGNPHSKPPNAHKFFFFQHFEPMYVLFCEQSVPTNMHFFCGDWTLSRRRGGKGGQSGPPAMTLSPWARTPPAGGLRTWGGGWGPFFFYFFYFLKKKNFGFQKGSGNWVGRYAAHPAHRIPCVIETTIGEKWKELAILGKRRYFLPACTKGTGLRVGSQAGLVSDISRKIPAGAWVRMRGSLYIFILP